MAKVQLGSRPVSQYSRDAVLILEGLALRYKGDAIYNGYGLVLDSIILSYTIVNEFTTSETTVVRAHS